MQLALIHYFQQTKADVTVPVFAASLILWLIAYRLVAWWQDTSELSTLTLLGLSIAVSVVTFIGEAAGIGVAYHVSPMRVLDVAFDFSAGIRPGWQVLAAGLVVVMIDFVRGRWAKRSPRPRLVRGLKLAVAISRRLSSAPGRSELRIACADRSPDRYC